MNFKNLVLAIFSVGFLFSCSEDFKVGSGYKDVTIVWSLLDMSDTATYVKVNKGYYDESANNLSLAKVADSIYYKNLNVTLEELSSANTVVSTTTLTKVDANLEGFIKDSGVFANSPNWAYKTKQTLKGDTRYRLRVKNLETGKEVYGETKVLTNDNVEFNVQNLFAFGVKDYSVVDSFNIIKWVVPEGAVTTDGFIRFHYVEQIGSGPFFKKFVDIPIFLNQPSTHGVVNGFTFYNDNFYNGIGSFIPSASNGLTRYVDTADYIFYCGGQEIYDYIKVADAQGGITFDQIKPLYTNLKGNDVYGVISSKVKRIYYTIPFSSKTIDKLKTHSATKNLNFNGVSPI